MPNHYQTQSGGQTKGQINSFLLTGKVQHAVIHMAPDRAQQLALK